MLIGMAVAYGDGDVFHPISAMSSVRWKVPACWCSVYTATSLFVQDWTKNRKSCELPSSHYLIRLAIHIFA